MVLNYMQILTFIHSWSPGTKSLKFFNSKNIDPIQMLHAKKYSVLKVEDQHKFNICCLIHKIIYHPGNIPKSMNGLLILHKDMHKYNARNKNNIHDPCHIYQQSDIWFKKIGL